ncbi:sigma-70 family RNA polymerase sigma factor [Saccharopolyspora halophila]|uniref:Sigma-70 family RNA polymerase sigma factor n=1 Tax=Saccharopolyspora halophila TaxID=405551 RepID=A0ABN3GP00_9PSEU
MRDSDVLARRFEEHRARLNAVAYRMLGSHGEAEEAVQEAWLRVDRAGTDGVDNFGGWLTTIVGRVCLDLLRARKARPERTVADLPEQARGDEPAPESEAELADTVGMALFVVLETLDPPERLAFVLHDVFGVPFDEIAPIVGKGSAATRQLASRARRRVRRTDVAEQDPAAQREVVEAFLGAARDGDFETLLAVLDPDVVLRADEAAVSLTRRIKKPGVVPLVPESRGARAIAEMFRGRSGVAGFRPALVGDTIGAAWAPKKKPHAVFAMAVEQGRITAIDVIVDPEHIARLDPLVLS